VKGTPGLIKVKVHATRKKHIFLAFFDSKGLINMNFMPRGRTVTAADIIEALTSFLRVLKEKRLMMTAGNWWFHWDNMPVHTAALVTNLMTARRFQIMEHPPYLPDLAPADFVLFPSVKRELADKTLTKETLKKEWEGVVRTLSAADFTSVFRWRYDRCKKCVNIAGGSVQKS
jgi:histone-lysine N-methyltransferase SETMAR